MKLPISTLLLICMLPLNSCEMNQKEVEAKPFAKLRDDVLEYDITIINNGETELLIRENCNLRATTITDHGATSLIYNEILLITA